MSDTNPCTCQIIVENKFLLNFVLVSTLREEEEKYIKGENELVRP